MSKRMHHDPSIVTIAARRWIRLDGKNQPTGDPNRGTGYVLHPDDRPRHAGGCGRCAGERAKK